MFISSAHTFCCRRVPHVAAAVGSCLSSLLTSVECEETVKITVLNYRNPWVEPAASILAWVKTPWWRHQKVRNEWLRPSGCGNSLQPGLPVLVSRYRAPFSTQNILPEPLQRALDKSILMPHLGDLLILCSIGWLLQIYSSEISKVINCTKMQDGSKFSGLFIKKTLVGERLRQIKKFKEDDNFRQRRKLYLSVRVTLLLLWGVPCSCLQGSY